jgi:hypothetical protein
VVNMEPAVVRGDHVDHLTIQLAQTSRRRSAPIWWDWCRAKRHKLPDYVPDVPAIRAVNSHARNAGAFADIQLTTSDRTWRG